jgi:hypothetical protein
LSVIVTGVQTCALPISNEHDISVANESVKIVSLAQYQTINKQR